MMGNTKSTSQEAISDVKNKKKDQGNHECEVLGIETEAIESEAQWRECRKNRDHPAFIPISEMSIEQLPRNFQTRDALDYVRTIANLTVMLRVNYVSEDRPNHFAFSHSRGLRALHIGTALVCDVMEHSGPCKCVECAKSPCPSSDQRWYEIHMETALHVLFNTEEARHTRVDFFYDSDTSHVDGKQKTIWATEVKKAYERGDFCSFVCATHDDSLAKELQEFLKKSTRRNFYGYSGRWMSSGWDHMCVMASHPHGQPKKITIGRLTNEHEITPAHRYFVYNLNTCPGSSGARAGVVEHNVWNKEVSFSMSWLPPHSRTVNNAEMNASTAACAGYADPHMAAHLEDVYFHPSVLCSAIK